MEVMARGLWVYFESKANSVCCWMGQLQQIPDLFLCSEGLSPLPWETE